MIKVHHLKRNIRQQLKKYFLFIYEFYLLIISCWSLALKIVFHPLPLNATWLSFPAGIIKLKYFSSSVVRCTSCYNPNKMLPSRSQSSSVGRTLWCGCTCGVKGPSHCGVLTLSAHAAWTWAGPMAAALTAWSCRWRRGRGQAARAARTGWRTTGSASVTLALWTAWRMAMSSRCWTHHLPLPPTSHNFTSSPGWWGSQGAWHWICPICRPMRVGRVAAKRPAACPAHRRHWRTLSLSQGAPEIIMQLPPWLKTAFFSVTTSHWGSPSTMQR